MNMCIPIPLNEEIERSNNRITVQFSGQQIIYYITYFVENRNHEISHTIEYLDNLKLSSFPQNLLLFQITVQFNLLRNLNLVFYSNGPKKPLKIAP